MPRLVRILLTIAFILFLGGVIWSFWAVSQREETVTVAPGVTDTTITTSTTLPPAEVTPPTPAPSPGIVNKPAPAKKPRPQQVQYYTYYYEETGTSSGASAWARSGVNADGSTYAEAHAQ